MTDHAGEEPGADARASEHPRPAEQPADPARGTAAEHSSERRNRERRVDSERPEAAARHE